MTIEELKDYRSAKAELEDVTMELAENEVQICVQSAAKHPYSVHSVSERGLAPTDRVKYLIERKGELERHLRAVETFISAQDKQMRFILRQKYILGRSNLYIAMKLGYQDEGTIRKKIKKIF